MGDKQELFYKLIKSSNVEDWKIAATLLKQNNHKWQLAVCDIFKDVDINGLIPLDLYRMLIDQRPPSSLIRRLYPVYPADFAKSNKQILYHGEKGRKRKYKI